MRLGLLRAVDRTGVCCSVAVERTVLGRAGVELEQDVEGTTTGCTSLLLSTPASFSTCSSRLGKPAKGQKYI